LTPLLTGLGLAGAAGLNAWAVLLLFQGLVRLLPQEFPGPTAGFLGSPFVFQLSVVLFLLEFVVKKIPLVDRFWELGQTLLRPAVGALLAMAAFTSPSLPVRIATGLAGAAATLAIHLAMSTTRMTSTAATRGFAQFALSLAEDALAVAFAALTFFVPWFAPLFLGAALFLLLTHRQRVWRAVQVLFFRLQHPRRPEA